MDDMLVLFTGTIDEEYLLGTKVEGSEQQTELGVKFTREGGFYKELTTPTMGHLFWNNVIPGITDHDTGGTKFLQSFPQE
ncbi:hypothetical protein G647_07890 [Cladophialophora carrionii CBS 160.54]|uniref:Uncharacterized protein n=1 Tax=Cladophialophora carrionii CBS 160.54 TaxID=1279043 RepID=V9D5H3_9EURO|nr:uncharacterized protein G647_07890 [Cladophialophora carrionii CBS 160.54]ETI21543.1 hypothetical protein G647_07890 [Cladophialophora carrionii CBS 160.54]